jgi:ATP-binding cassette subfamily F protein 3
MRVALAGALFARPDLLLLDEPTNHLDLEATLWLESYLASWPGTLIVISHERRLLNSVVDEIVHLSDLRLTRYAGTYDRFERVRRENLMHESKMRDRQIAEQRRIQSFVDRFRAKATKASQAQSRLKMLARMEPITSVIEEHTVAFAFPNPDPMPPPLIALENVAVGYASGQPVLSRLNLRIDMDDRIALIGANGNGKSTLVKLLSGRLNAMEGTLRRPSKLRIGYFAQHQAEELNAAGTAFSHVAARMPEAREPVVRAHLGRFGFAQNKADVPVSSLSGGEKARLLFALMSLGAPHILLLDEPTNHLDVDAREALVEALNGFEGAVILVSHDAHLIDLVCDRLWLVGDGTCAPFDGTLDDYARRLIEQRRAAKRNDGEAPRDARRDARRNRAASRAGQAPLRRAAAQADRRLAEIGERKRQLEAELAAPETYALPPGRLTALQIALAEAGRALAEAEEAWLAAHAALEEAE